VRGFADDRRHERERLKQDRGFVKFLWEVFNDRGECVMTLVCPQMVLRRHPGAPA